VKIPKFVMVKGKKYRIRLVKDLEHETDGKVDGLCELETRTIYIEKSLKKKERDAVLLHELFHAIVYEAHINPGVRFSDSIEEVLCDAFADFHITTTNIKWK
jgi:Zn-dependent peptidase ImmA (M78 family)